MKLWKNILKVCLIILVLTVCTSNVIYADEVTDNITIEPPSGDNIITNIAGTVLGVVEVIALCVIAISFVILAIKYMYSSPNEKATIKQQMMPVIIGATIVFAASWALNLAQGFVKDALPK